MEWVEVTGKSVEEAVDSALDELGVDESDAEVEVLEEPKLGLFGKVRSEARVRARVAPTSARPKAERRGRRERRRGAGSGGGNPTPSASPTDSPEAGGGVPASPPASADPPVRVARQEQAASRATASAPAPGEDASDGPQADEVAQEFLEGLLEVFDLGGQVARREIDEDTVEVAVTGGDLGLLIGPRGQTLSALQDLTRGVVQRASTADRRRIVIDVGGYRQARREALERFTRAAASEVLASGVTKVLEPMPAPDRKVVHDTANAIDGIRTMSEGEDPQRRVVILRDDS